MAALVIQHREGDVGDVRHTIYSKWIQVNTLKQGVKVALSAYPGLLAVYWNSGFMFAFKTCLSQNSVVFLLEFKVQEDFEATVLSNSFLTLLLSCA